MYNAYNYCKLYHLWNRSIRYIFFYQSLISDKAVSMRRNLFTGRDRYTMNWAHNMCMYKKFNTKCDELYFAISYYYIRRRRKSFVAVRILHHSKYIISIDTNMSYGLLHYSDVIIGATVSQIASLTIIYWTVYTGGNQIKHQNSASLAFVRGIHR